MVKKPVKCKVCHKEIKTYDIWKLDDEGLSHIDCPSKLGKLKKPKYQQEHWNWNKERRNFKWD